MNSKFERGTTTPSVEDLKAMQQTALRANLDKASNIQKSITLTEANWTGLTNAVELTGQAVLKQQETMERLISAEQMAEMLKAQLDSLTAEHAGAIREMRSAVRELTEVSAESWEQMRQIMTDTVNATKWQQETMLKDFKSQVGSARENYYSQLSSVTDTLKESVNSMRRKMYLPTIILVLWELVRYLFLRG